MLEMQLQSEWNLMQHKHRLCPVLSHQSKPLKIKAGVLPGIA